MLSQKLIIQLFINSSLEFLAGDCKKKKLIDKNVIFGNLKKEMIVIQFNVKKFVKWDKESDFFPRKRKRKRKGIGKCLYLNKSYIKKNIDNTHTVNGIL